ncbi:MAG: ATP-dependent zinc metalloprotease FtsH [Steroidobacteraceae bacterium]
MDSRQHFSLWYFIAALLVLLALQTWLATARIESLAYSDFKILLQAGKLRDLSLSETDIMGTMDLTATESLLPHAVWQGLTRKGGNERSFVTKRVTDPELTGQMQAAKVRFQGVTSSNWLPALLSWVLPALIFVAIWSYAMRRMGAGGGAGDLMGVGKSKAKVYVQKNIGVTFADVEGIDEAKQELMEVVDFLRTPERYQRLGGRIPKGVLIVGAPGTGKTLLAKAVAGEADVPFLSISGSEFVEMFVGVGAARVRDLFKQAEQLAPCIIFIDELDALGKSRGAGVWSGQDEREQTLNQLLVEMDGFDTNKGVIIMAATNRPEILDPALLRPGRFDRTVAIDRPDIKGREKILRLHAKRLTLAADVDLASIAARSAGCAGADLANIVNEAALHAARLDKAAVDMSDFETAIDRALGGLEKKNRVMTASEKQTVACHEAGHALIAEHRASTDRVAKISIIPRGIGALGYTQQLPTEDRYLLKRSELLDRLDVLLGGRCAEMLTFGEPSTGAQNDLQRATDLARHMVTQYGMSDALGAVTLETRSGPAYLGDGLRATQHEYSELTAQHIDAEIQRLLQEAEQRVRTTLSQQRETLESLATLLLQHETVDRDMLKKLLDGKQLPSSTTKGVAA